MTNLRKKIRHIQKVDIDNEIDNIPVGKYTGKEHWTKGAEILVLDNVRTNKSPAAMVMAMQRQENNRFYRKREKDSYSLMKKILGDDFKKYRKLQADKFFHQLSMVLQECSQTMMHIALTR